MTLACLPFLVEVKHGSERLLAAVTSRPGDLK